MKHILLVAGLLVLQGVCAQQKLDVVHTKNGSVVRGRVFAVDGSVIRMVSRVKDTLVFEKAEIDSIVQEQRAEKHKGFYNIDEGGIQFSEKLGTAWRIIGGYHVAKQLQVGIGVGLDDYKARSVPVFADVRYHFKLEGDSYFLYGGGGVALPWMTSSQWRHEQSTAPKKYEPGLYAHGGVGYRFGMMHVGIGYAHTAFKAKYEIFDFMTRLPMKDYAVTSYEFNRLTVMLGVTL